MRRFDAVIVGAGPAGSTAALALARSGLEVAVVEKAPFPRAKVCGEFISATTWPVLAALGAGALDAMAGPAVRRVGLLAGATALAAPMPRPASGEPWGRAVTRDRLDPALLALAVAAGACAFQPARVRGVRRLRDGFRVALQSGSGAPGEIHARLIVAAHGSWERSPLPGAPWDEPRDSDLLGFKARFTGTRLAADLMPLVLFPGGYGGMVHVDGGTASFSCCIRRDALRRARACRPGPAGDAVLAHARASSSALDAVLAGAVRDTPWLSAGPIRPGVRARYREGVFSVGNAAGEAHPLIAEGISMAVQSASLACGAIAAAGSLGDAALDEAGQRYSAAWQRHFAARIRASRAFAALTIPSIPRRASVALLSLAPAALTLGARFGGKARVAEPLGGTP
ncbi:MAG TPA: FAD-dependent oxidoreductase [Usitatibacter sp.]|nr:FAD-dependent oxidoreductase [Usitatibacter sp.]